MKDLVAFYRERAHLFNEEDDWCHALKDFFLLKQIDEVLAYSLTSECQKLPVDNPNDYLCNLRKITTLSFLFRLQSTVIDKSVLRNAYRNLYIKGFWKELQLGEALYALGCHLLGDPPHKLEPQQLAKGGVLIETGGHLSDGSVPDLILNAELALIWLFLGWKTRNDRLVQAAMKWVHLSMGLFDHENRPFHGFWLCESKYNPLLFLTVYWLMFSLSSELMAISKAQYLADSLFEALYAITDEDFVVPPVFLTLFASILENSCGNVSHVGESHSFSINEIDKSLGYLSTKQNGISLACVFSGVNTGLGSLHKTNVQIVSFGPHYSPLSDSGRYGLHRVVSGLSDSFRDVRFEKKADAFIAEGWARMISPCSLSNCDQNITLAQPGNQWVYFSASGNGEKIFFKSRLSKHDARYSLYFAYFIVADCAYIGSEKFLPATLRRYQGASQPVTFKKYEEVLTLSPHMQGEMQVIPLAGGHHFWAANFLLAFLFEENQNFYFWEIK